MICNGWTPRRSTSSSTWSRIPEVRHLLLVGAYRDNEVGPSHPLMRTLEAIRTAGARVHEIVLAPLGLDDVDRLIADALHCEPERALPLAQLVHEKTGGNPFFAIQFFTALADEGLLAFDPVAPGWQWDMNRIRAKSYTDNVVELMAGKLKRLSAPTQEALKQLACLGNIAEIATLTLVHGETAEAMHAALWEAVQAGLVFRLESAYTFLHDRIQQAAYSLIPEEHRAGVHLRIGRVLLASMTADGLAEHVFEIVNQLNRGAALITARDEREQLAELNLIAGRRAKASTAYASALTYLVAGAALLAEDSWERRHELTFALELNRAECEFLTGALAEAEQRLTALSARAATTVERASVTCLRADLYTTLDQGSRAIAVGLDYLRHLGIDWSPHPTEDEARREYERIWSQLGSRAIERLIDLPLMSDPVSLATLDVLSKMATPALYTDANLYLLVICRQVNLSLEHGNCDASCFAYEWLAMVAGARFGDYRAAYSFGRLGYDLVEQRGLKRFQARTYLIFGGLIIPWTRHVKSGRDLLRRSFEAANKIGDLTYAAYSCDQLNTNMLAAGDSLVEAQREFEHGLEFARKVRFGLVIDLISAELGLVRTLRGLTRKFGSFDDEQFDEREIERRFASNPDLALAECWYSIRKLQARFFAGDYAAALEAASTAQRLLWTSVSRFETAEYHFYGALSHAASCDCAAPTSDGSMSRPWPRTTDSSRSGRRIARRISRTAPHWSGRRSPGSKAARSMPWIFTNRPSARHAQTALSTTRPSPTSWRAASISIAVSRKRPCPHARRTRLLCPVGRRGQDEAARSALSAFGRSGTAPSRGDQRFPGPAPRRRERRQSVARPLRRDRARGSDRHADANRGRKCRRADRPSDSRSR